MSENGAYYTRVLGYTPAEEVIHKFREEIPQVPDGNEIVGDGRLDVSSLVFAWRQAVSFYEAEMGVIVDSGSSSEEKSLSLAASVRYFQDAQILKREIALLGDGISCWRCRPTIDVPFFEMGLEDPFHRGFSDEEDGDELTRLELSQLKREAWARACFPIDFTSRASYERDFTSAQYFHLKR